MAALHFGLDLSTSTGERVVLALRLQHEHCEVCDVRLWAPHEYLPAGMPKPEDPFDESGGLGAIAAFGQEGDDVRFGYMGAQGWSPVETVTGRERVLKRANLGPSPNYPEAPELEPGHVDVASLTAPVLARLLQKSLKRPVLWDCVHVVGYNIDGEYGDGVFHLPRDGMVVRGSVELRAPDFDPDGQQLLMAKLARENPEMDRQDLEGLPELQGLFMARQVDAETGRTELRVPRFPHDYASGNQAGHYSRIHAWSRGCQEPDHSEAAFAHVVWLWSSLSTREWSDIFAGGPQWPWRSCLSPF